MTAQRLIWGKFSNAGQTCIAPDYILCSKAVQIKLVEQFKKVLDEFYGSNRQDNKDLARIINVRHWSRLRSVLKRSKGDIVIGGEMDEYDLWISPTIIGRLSRYEDMMQII
jgi:acyl-CoA reductase-like NAD-dependent aldehyde dehydrogenase